MFNAEKLLGKILGDVMGGSGKSGRGVTDSLTSGAGLMTIIGLGVGAYEILKDQQNKQGADNASSASAPVPPPPPTGGTGGGSAPPPLPGGGSTPPPSPAMPPLPGSTEKKGLQGEELARRMIQGMIAAAHADGVMDEEEKETILRKLESHGLDEEEKAFLLAEMDRPLSISQLTAGMNDPVACRALYRLAESAVTVDTVAEQTWFDSLGEALGLGSEV